MHYFFKVMMHDFHQKLRLPPATSNEIRKEKPRIATLQSRLGKWKISLCSDDEYDDLICFNKGWPEIVHSHALTTADRHFHVYVFDHSACEKQFLNHPINEVEVEDEDEEGNENNTTNHSSKKDEEDESPISYFEKKMVLPANAAQIIRIGIPKEFMRSNKLGLRMSARLRDPSGRVWEMNLVRDNKDLQFQLVMGGKWRAFFASNGLNDGDICTFRLMHRFLTPTTLFFDVHIKRASL